MGTHRYNETLLETVGQKLPGRITPATFLMDILCIGREAAYRRLRGEVPLTLEEAARLAKALDISIDMILKTGNEKISSYRMSMTEFENPTETDYRFLEESVELIRSAADDPLSRLSLSANMFPRQLYLQCGNLTRFFLFKKNFHETGKQAKSYHQVFIPERMRRVFRDSFEAYRQFKFINFIFDRQIFIDLVHNIKHFYSIGLIRKQDIVLLREDILKMITYLENIAITGKYENGTQINLYISNINFVQNCYNIKIQDRYISIMEAYILYGIVSTDKADYDRMEEWLLSKCRLSTMISICGEPQRIAFFNEQRRMLETLVDAPGSIQK